MKAIVKSTLGRLGYQLKSTRFVPRQLLDPAKLRSIQFDDVVCRHMINVGDALTFIQVGAYDGVTRDPLRKYIDKYNWRGVLVEPQSRAAAQLRSLYQHNKQITVLQAAVDWTPGHRKLFTVRSEGIPSWVGGLSSFDRDIILKHVSLVAGLADMIEEEIVDCLTFNEITSYLPAGQLDLLQLDTEGADGDILSLFPFDRIQPAILHWEVKHMSKAERERCLDRLANLGYRFAPSGAEDMIAVK